MQAGFVFPQFLPSCNYSNAPELEKIIDQERLCALKTEKTPQKAGFQPG
jgi:hypothetical protein